MASSERSVDLDISIAAHGTAARVILPLAPTLRWQSLSLLKRSTNN